MAPNVDAAVAAQNSQIQQLYDALANDLGAGVTATKDIYADASQGVGGAYDQGMSALDSTMANLSARIGKSADMLGLSDATPSALSVLQGNLAANKSGMITNKTADLSALAGEGAAYGAVGQRQIGAAHATGAKAQTEAGSKLKSALYQMMGEEEQAKSQVELQGLKNQSALDQLRMELEGRKAEQEFNLRQAELQAQGDPLDALRAEKLAAEIDKLRREGGGGITDFGRGQAGIEAFMAAQGFGTDDSTQGAIDKFYDLIERSTTTANARKDQGQAGDPYLLAQQYLMDDFRVPGAVGADDLAPIRMALDIWYGKYGAPKYG